MPDGELPPNGLPAQIMEFWADIYTEAVRPMYPMVMVGLILVCSFRWAWRVRQRRQNPPVDVVAAVAMDGPD